MRRPIVFASLLLALTATAADNFSYVLSRGDGDRDSVITGADVDSIVRVHERYKDAPYLWARRNGKQYLIRDAATLAEARAAFLKADALHAEHERLQQKMRPLEKKERDLERRIDALEDDDRDAGHLREQLRPITRQLRALEAEEERIDDQEELLAAAAETKLREIVERAIERGVAQPVR